MKEYVYYDAISDTIFVSDSGITYEAGECFMLMNCLLEVSICLIGEL
jgi:hypothetical protein